MACLGCHRGLFLPREEGGQGLIHRASQIGTFWLQFIQRFLIGPAGVLWIDVTSCILRRLSNLGQNNAVFEINWLPPFYCGILKSWPLFICGLRNTFNCRFWLLKKPLINGARLDIFNNHTPGLIWFLILMALCLKTQGRSACTQQTRKPCTRNASRC